MANIGTLFNGHMQRDLKIVLEKLDMLSDQQFPLEKWQGCLEQFMDPTDLVIHTPGVVAYHWSWYHVVDKKDFTPEVIKKEFEDHKMFYLGKRDESAGW
jgi:hypothetical protein